MLPAVSPTRRSLADVVPSALAALGGTSGALGLPPVDHAVVVLVDGLGAHPLRASAGHARTLREAMTGRWTIASPFPTTTASALATLTTGALAGAHGLVGYSVLDAEGDRVVNQLNGWGGRVDPTTWQRLPTLFETSDVPCAVVGPPRYADSGFTRAVLRGATYEGAASIPERVARAAEVARRHERSLTYLYVPELDMIAHRSGWASPAWAEALEGVDAAVRDLVAALPPRSGVLVTADHGMVDLDDDGRVVIDPDSGLLDGVRHVAGEPRALQLHLEPDLAPAARAALVERWRAAEQRRGWVATRDEAIAAGWFGEVHPDVAPRIGDLIVAARARVGYYDGRDPHGLGMVGNHGSWSDEEVDVPAIRLGAFAR